MNDTQKGKLALLIGTTDKACDLYAAIVDLIENDVERSGNSKFAPERDIDTVYVGGYTPKPISGSRPSPPSKE